MDTRILIADRQDMFREVLRRLAGAAAGLHRRGETDDGQKLVRLAAELKPDIILLDLKLHRLSGTEALHQIALLGTGIRAILLTDSIHTADIVQTLLWGVRGVVRKDDATHMLFKSIRAVKTGQYWINHEEVAEVVQRLRSMAEIIEENARSQAKNLSRQQQQIIEQIVAGCSNKEIAEEMSISERTVKYHLTRIFEKFGVSGRMELARYSLKNKVVREA